MKGGGEDLKDDLTHPASLLFTPKLRTFVVSPGRGHNPVVPSINLPQCSPFTPHLCIMGKSLCLKAMPANDVHMLNVRQRRRRKLDCYSRCVFFCWLVFWAQSTTMDYIRAE